MTMSERLTLAEAQERARTHCDAVGVHLDVFSGTDPDAEADHLVIVSHNWPACRGHILAIAATLRAYARHLAYEEGAKAERANAVALLRREAARLRAEAEKAVVESAPHGEPYVSRGKDMAFRRECQATSVSCASMYIERGDRAERLDDGRVDR